MEKLLKLISDSKNKPLNRLNVYLYQRKVPLFLEFSERTPLPDKIKSINIVAKCEG
jgi:hypothetical protein